MAFIDVKMQFGCSTTRLRCILTGSTISNNRINIQIGKKLNIGFDHTSSTFEVTFSLDQNIPTGLGELMQSGEAVWRGGKPGSTPAVSLKKKTGKSQGEMVAEDRR